MTTDIPDLANDGKMKRREKQWTESKDNHDWISVVGYTESVFEGHIKTLLETFYHAFINYFLNGFYVLI